MSRLLRAVSVRAGLFGVVACTALGVAAGTASASTPTLNLNTVTVPSGLELVSSEALAPDGTTMYVSSGVGFAGEGGPVEAITLGSTAAATPITTDGTTPITEAGGVALSPDGKYLYVTNDSGSGPAVYVIDTSTDEAVGSGIGAASSDELPGGVAVSPDGDSLYFTNVNEDGGEDIPSSSLTTVDLTTPTTGTVADTVGNSNLGYTGSLAIAPSGKYLYAANLLGPAAVAAVSGTTVGAITSLPDVYDAYGIAVSPDGNTLYSSPFSFLSVIGGEAASESNSEIQTFGIGGGGSTATFDGATVLPIGGLPLSLTVNATGTIGYVGTLTDTDVSGDEEEVGGVDEFAIARDATGIKTSGKAAVGQKLTASFTGAISAGGTYQWYANGTAISGAKASTLALTLADYGKKITVKGTPAPAPGYYSVSLTSAATAAVAKGTLAAATPKVTGSPKVGTTLKASVAAWSPSGVKLTYQWYASGKKVSGATKQTLKLTDADAGKTFLVKVTGTKAGYKTATKTSKATGKVAG